MLIGPINNDSMREHAFTHFYLEDVERFDRDGILCIVSTYPRYISPEYLIYFTEPDGANQIQPIPGFYLYRSKFPL